MKTKKIKSKKPAPKFAVEIVFPGRVQFTPAPMPLGWDDSGSAFTAPDVPEVLEIRKDGKVVVSIRFSEEGDLCITNMSGDYSFSTKNQVRLKNNSPWQP